ncbi:DUF1318 domain-containing protein [bacterium]|nr:DUF1318 domain-containing protein [bacterium]
MQTRDLAGDMTAGFVSGQAEFTPVLREAVLSRNLRHDEIRGFLEKGLIGEGNLGLVEVRLETAAQIAEPDKNRLASLVAEENEDRQKIYNEYAQIKGLDIGGWSEVPLHFAEEIRQQLMPGDWFQVPGHPDFYTRFLEGPIAPFFPTEPTPSAWVQIPAAYMSPSAPREAAPPME